MVILHGADLKIGVEGKPLSRRVLIQKNNCKRLDTFNTGQVEGWSSLAVDWLGWESTGNSSENNVL